MIVLSVHTYTAFHNTCCGQTLHRRELVLFEFLFCFSGKSRAGYVFSRAHHTGVTFCAVTARSWIKSRVTWLSFGFAPSPLPPHTHTLENPARALRASTHRSLRYIILRKSWIIHFLSTDEVDSQGELLLRVHATQGEKKKKKTHSPEKCACHPQTR